MQKGIQKDSHNRMTTYVISFLCDIINNRRRLLSILVPTDLWRVALSNDQKRYSSCVTLGLSVRLVLCSWVRLKFLRRHSSVALGSKIRVPVPVLFGKYELESRSDSNLQRRLLKLTFFGLIRSQKSEVRQRKRMRRKYRIKKRQRKSRDKWTLSGP